MTDSTVQDTGAPEAVPSGPSPDGQRDHDPGDQTQLNFAYQHAYGVILLVGAARGELPYTMLWCEHHEDFLCERSDSRFDAYQIKTRQPERGPWKLTDEDFSKSIRRFVQLDGRYPGWIATFRFVSNTRCSNAASLKEIGWSPRQLLGSVLSSQDHTRLHVDDPINEKLTQAHAKLAHACDCDEATLFRVLKRVELIEGPSRADFESVIAHDHLGGLPNARHLPPADLNRLRDEVIQRIALASSLRNVDPARHWCCIDKTDLQHPELLAKRVSLHDFQAMLLDRPEVPFQFLPAANQLELGHATAKGPILDQKLTQGGLSEHITMMRTRALSAERHLMSLAYRQPDRIDDILNQLVTLVHGVCLEAKLQAELADGVFGPKMLSEVYQRLRVESATRPEMCHQQQPECLIGIAGLLTGDCLVWWSKKFDLAAVS